MSRSTPHVGTSACVSILAVIVSGVVLGTPSLFEITADLDVRAEGFGLLNTDTTIGMYRMCVEMAAVSINGVKVAGANGCETLNGSCDYNGDGKTLKSDSCDRLLSLRLWFDASVALGVLTLIVALIAACTTQCSLWFAFMFSLAAMGTAGITIGYAMVMYQKDLGWSGTSRYLNVNSKFGYGFYLVCVCALLHLLIAIGLNRSRISAQQQHDTNDGYIPMAVVVSTSTSTAQATQPHYVHQPSYPTGTNMQSYPPYAHQFYPQQQQPTYHTPYYIPQPPADQEPSPYMPPEPRFVLESTHPSATNEY